MKGLPANPDAERFILGSILLDDTRFVHVAAGLRADEFSLDKHRRIFGRMLEMHGRGEKIDRVTIANELLRYNELESVDGLGYLVSLDDGLPHISNLDSYVKIVRDKASLRAIAINAQHLMSRALTAEDDPDEILAGAEEGFLRISERRHDDAVGLKQGGKFLREFPGGMQAFAEPHRRENGLRTGFTKFDEMTGGLRAGEMFILAARPSMGKTALALNIAWNVATRLFQPVAIFSLEMSTESLLLRMLCSAARIDSHRMRAGYLNEGERQKLRACANQMVEAPVYIDDAANLDLMGIHAKLLSAQHREGIKFGLVVVDYLQLMATTKAENRNQEVSRLSRGLKLMSKELGCPFLVLSQLSRDAEKRPGDKRPQLSDLRESGSLEQDCDLCAFIFREEVYKRDREDLRGVAELILAKQRSGPIGKIDLVFMHSMTKFENRSEDLPPDDIESRLPYAED